ncbi:hypothetical protein ADK66_22145 [Micromonospora sp. NRRL B-16802]|uniref:hypothetical protein n=1 Tax=Micromonospora sp. NRRL B-16802 TaxID=1415541 RepID=UPI0006AEA53A|nr:hypothetical protein [Micromonospora sp. NRRL B-16802]KOX06682.1 hypothetical protein ADK66_22145 [Micromonospora sp. NRRL B-16802]
MPRHPDTVISPNTLLCDARRRQASPRRPGQSLSRSELADAVNAALDRLYPGRVLTAHYVDSRWIGKLERGEHRWPSEERRAALRHVLGATSDGQLDLYSPRRTDVTTTADHGTGQPMPGSWDETLYQLRAQWHLLVQNDKLFGPQYALIGVTAQLNLLDRLLNDVPSLFRPSLVRLAAQYAESAAWLNHSLNDVPAAQLWTRKALALADQIADPAMTAWATYRSSQHWLIAGKPRRAVEEAEAAMLQDKKVPSPVRAALRVQHAHALATVGEHREAMQLLDNAHGWAADRTPAKPEGEHASYCTSGYIEVHRGTCLRIGRRPDEAIKVLDAALPSIPSLHRQDFTAALLTKAAAHVAADQPEQAAATAHIALPIARRAGTRRILHQLSQIGSAVDEHRHLADVRAFLDDLVETA